KLGPAAQLTWLRERWASKLGDIEPNRRPDAALQWTRQLPEAKVEAFSVTVEPGILVPLLLLRPAGNSGGRLPVVVAVSEHGKREILASRAREIELLLKSGRAVCLPDVRGTGETSP